jgi:hypothetical protein
MLSLNILYLDINYPSCVIISRILELGEGLLCNTLNRFLAFFEHRTGYPNRNERERS